MGANAQTSVPAFTAGQVLTAAQVTGINTGIPVFASSTERDAAFGGTGEKTLAEGQMAYLEDTNETQYYDGSSWLSVGSTPGLTLVKSQAIGSAVSSVTVSNAFSADYENYRITVNGGVASVAATVSLKLGASTASYYQAYHYITYSTGAANILTVNNGSVWTYSGQTQTNYITVNVDLQNPFLAKYTTISGFSAGSVGAYTVGYHASATSYTDFTIAHGGTLTGGTIRVYGYNNG